MRREVHREVERIVTLILISVLFSVCAFGATNILRGERISLHYPSTMSKGAATLLLANREAAIVYAEEALGCVLKARISTTIQISVFGTGGLGGYGGTSFGLPLYMIEEFEAAQVLPPSVLGCHEEVHTVAASCWGSSAPSVLKEGLATFLDRQYRGGSDYLLITRGLLDSGELPSLENLLTLSLASRSTLQQYLAIYLGGAALIEFILANHNMEKVHAFYTADLRATILPEAIRDLFGCSVDELETSWHTYIRDCTDGREFTAELLIEAILQSNELSPLTMELGKMYRARPRFLGRSELCESAYRGLGSYYSKLENAETPEEAELALGQYFCSVEQAEYLLGTWLDAVDSYRQARTEEGNPIAQIQSLRRALDRYRIVGDTLMVGILEELLATKASP